MNTVAFILYELGVDIVCMRGCETTPLYILSTTV